MKLPKIIIPRRVKVLSVGLSIVLALVGLWIGIVELAAFANRKEFVFNKIIEMKLAWPITIKDREILAPVIKVALAEEKPVEIKTELDQYICDKFGVYECKTALAVARAESGMKEDNINKNENGSYDVGIFQVNSVHWGQEGCSLKELADAHKNVDCAYNLWKSQGWSIWVAYTNDRYLSEIR